MIRKTCQWVSKCISQKPLFWMLAQGKQACIAAWKTTTLIFRRIPRTSPLIQSKFSHCVESIFFSQDSRVSYLDFSPKARLPRTSWIDGESRPSSPFMGPFPVLFCYVKFRVGLRVANRFYFFLRNRKAH